MKGITIAMGKTLVELHEGEPKGKGSPLEYNLTLDGKELCTIHLNATAQPGCSISTGPHTEAAIWAGTDVFLVDKASGVVSEYQHGDYVQAIYALDGLWCLIGDSTVATVDLRASQEISQFQHDEIITSSRWAGAILRICDLQNRVISLELVNGCSYRRTSTD